MVMLVTLQQARDHLRSDTSDDGADLEGKIMAASDAIINYVGDGVVEFNSFGEFDEDSAGDLIGVPEPMKAATLIMIGVLYADRDGQSFREGQLDDRLGKMSLPQTVHWLLDPLRVPRIG